MEMDLASELQRPSFISGKSSAVAAKNSGSCPALQVRRDDADLRSSGGQCLFMWSPEEEEHHGDQNGARTDPSCICHELVQRMDGPVDDRRKFYDAALHDLGCSGSRVPGFGFPQ